ncbi:MAG TPA: GNAT family N-acetyltransferase [Longimicrobium sp.]|nr:GNAT family N-acetyltransferase [Longimicrobium sp.]
MHSGKPLPQDVEVSLAAPEQEPVLANLLELYAHDFSELIDLQLGPDGRFGYPALPRYWTEEGRFPFLVTVDGHLAGFVLVSRGSRISGDPEVWDMAEFFIVRGCRKQGIGTAVAHEIWRRLPGCWEVRAMERHQAACAFWDAAIAGYTGGGAEPADVELEGRRWQLFSFTSQAAEGGP